MSKLQDLINQYCPNGVEYKKLNTICKIYDGTHKTPKYTNSGIKFVSVENIGSLYNTNKFISKEDFQNYKIKPQINDVFMTRIGSIGVCSVIEKNEPLAYYVSLALLRPNNQVLNSKFLKHIIESLHGRKELRKRTLVNAVPIKVNKDDIGKIIIPVPPLPVQEEIVRILDTFTELTQELTTQLNQELTLRKKQYEYYRDNLLDFGKSGGYKSNIIFKPLGEIAEISTGNSNTNEELEIGQYPFYVRSPIVRRKNTFEYNETAIITSGDGVGVGKIYHYVEGKYALHQRAYRIHIIDKNVLPKYYYYYMVNSFYNYISKNAVNSSVTSIRRPMLNEFPVPIPPLEEQQRIVDILDRFDSLCNNLTSGLPAEIKLRQQQYEYYRDKLLTFKQL